MKTWIRRLTPLLLLAQAACAAVDFSHPGPAASDYAALFPTYAEFCAVSQILKKPGFGADLRGQPGGHGIFYLQGACRAEKQGPTTLALCGTPEAEPGQGVGISMNAHFRTAKWVASPGSAFVFRGDLPAGAPLTRDEYRAVQAKAEHLGIYTGVEFHHWVFDDMPKGTAPRDWKYEVSVATDYALNFGRGRVCARVPVSRAQLATMIDFLNTQNAPYREHRKVFEWSLFEDNCIHLAHNALAAAGIWTIWPTDMPLPIAILDFPVPRNEVINLMRRVDDPHRLDPLAVQRDPAARRALLDYGQLPLEPGGLMESAAPLTPNAVYDTDVGLIFYDDPVFGHYQSWSDRIEADPRRTALRTNLQWTLQTYQAASRAGRPLSWWLARDDIPDRATFAETYARFYDVLARETVRTEALLAQLDGAT